MKLFWSLIVQLQDKMKILGAISLMGMCLVTCADVFLRGAFNMPVYGSEEIVTIFAVMTIAFSLPYSHVKDVHIGVEIVVRLLSKTVQGRIRFITQSITLVLMCTITWRLFLYAKTMSRSGELSMNLALPMYYLVHLLSFCFLIFSLMILKDIIQYLKGVKQDT